MKKHILKLILLFSVLIIGGFFLFNLTNIRNGKIYAIRKNASFTLRSDKPRYQIGDEFTLTASIHATEPTTIALSDCPVKGNFDSIFLTLLLNDADMAAASVTNENRSPFWDWIFGKEFPVESDDTNKLTKITVTPDKPYSLEIKGQITRPNPDDFITVTYDFEGIEHGFPAYRNHDSSPIGIKCSWKLYKVRMGERTNPGEFSATVFFDIDH